MLFFHRCAHIWKWLFNHLIYWYLKWWALMYEILKIRFFMPPSLFGLRPLNKLSPKHLMRKMHNDISFVHFILVHIDKTISLHTVQTGTFLQVRRMGRACGWHLSKSKRESSGAFHREWVSLCCSAANQQVETHALHRRLTVRRQKHAGAVTGAHFPIFPLRAAA